MTAHQADQTTVLASLGIDLLPVRHEVLVDQSNHMEAVSHDQGVGEVLLGHSAIRLGEIHYNHPHLLLARQTLQIAAQAGF